MPGSRGAASSTVAEMAVPRKGEKQSGFFRSVSVRDLQTLQKSQQIFARFPHPPSTGRQHGNTQWAAVKQCGETVVTYHPDSATFAVIWVTDAD